MKLISLLTVAGLAVADKAKWESFKTKFGKHYSQVEEVRRYNTFVDNLAFIQQHNADYDAGKISYNVGVNEFADMTQSEFHAYRLAPTMDIENEGVSRKNYQCPETFAAQNSGSNPASVDWTSTSNPKSTVAVTHVKDQGSCGSCWSFGGTGTFEGAYCLAGLADCTSWNGASEQELVDCGTGSNSALGPYYDNACNGGWIDNALYYIQVTGYIDSEDSYPYVSGQTKTGGTCVSDPTNGLTTLSECGATKKNSETDLADALAEVGPIGVAIDASGSGFQLYKSGVYVNTRCSSSRLNHAVLAVGYGTDSDSGYDYYKVKNSWGTGWGDNGFILMRRNYNNMCGTAATPAYAIM